MYWLVEDESQLNVLINSSYKKAFIEVIPFSNVIHPAQTHVSLVYIRPIEATKGFMVCIAHSESLNALNTGIDKLLKKFEILYCRDKKETLHYFPNLSKSLYDITPPPTTYIRPTTQTHELYYRQHKDNHELNLIIPIVKHYEVCETIWGDLKANINNEKSKYNEFYNNKVSLVFNAIEQSGIHIHNETFEEYSHRVDGESVYTQFNLKTPTT